MIKKLLMIICMVFTVVCGSMLSAQILSPAEKGQLAQMLRSADFDSTDVVFLKDWDASTKFKLSRQVETLNNPWKFLDLLDEFRAMAQRINAIDSVRVESSFLNTYPANLSPYLEYGHIDNPDYKPLTDGSIPLPRMAKLNKPKDIFPYLESWFSETDKWLKKGMVNLSPAQQDSLAFWLYQTWQESEDSLVYKDFYANRFPNCKDTSMQAGIRLLEKVDFASLSYAWNIYENTISYLERQSRTMKFTNTKPIYHKSRWGTMIIGGTGYDRYCNDGKLLKSPPCFILEPAGNDIYDCALFTDRIHPFYVVLDMGGDDLYKNSSLGQQQNVLMGCGWLHDYDGNDVYQGSDFAFSARLGFQVLIDDKGDDSYTSGLFTQAAAMFGISVLHDKSGNDFYTATEFAQGLGGTKGFGLLLDGIGNDVYYTGGKYLHTPLAPFDYRSMAQGFGFGLRSDLAGGIGILYDGKGNDRYSGGVYAQGVSYWYAIGALIDDNGNDYYDAVYYPQGSGIHLANGALVDMSGEDHYYSKHGPGQGNGHDWSVGVFIDKKGNDQYSVEGGNGLGLTNSVGIFVDCEGDDKYEYKGASNYGYANSARETAGLGLFLDAGGKDSYPDSTKADNKTWQNGTYGVGRDIDLNKTVVSQMEELSAVESTTVDSLDSIDRIFAIASEWEVGSAVKRVKAARDILLKREAEAVPYVLKNKMSSKSGLEFRALEILTQASKALQLSLYSVLHSPDSLEVKNAMALITTLSDSTAIDSLAVFLINKKYIPTAISCLGAYKSDKALALISPWLSHHTEKYRYIAARSLKSMNTPSSLALLRKMDHDPSFLIKAMVRQLPKSQ